MSPMRMLVLGLFAVAVRQRAERGDAGQQPWERPGWSAQRRNCISVMNATACEFAVYGSW